MISLKLCIIGKYPPIQGGVSRQMYWLARCFAELGHQVHFVTNADEVELDYRMYIPVEERSKLECTFKNGGFVKLYTSYEPQQANYIPYTNPFVSKLAALAFDVVTEHGCSFIYTSYLEPYGFAGALVSQWTGIPYSVQHAGSDVGRLAQIVGRRSAYLQVIRNAALVITSDSMAKPLLSAGVEYEKLFVGIPGYLPNDYFSSKGKVLNIPKLLDEIKDTEFASSVFSKFDPSKPTIGIYGKPGQYKGTSEIIQALGQLKRKGQEFNFVAMCGIKGRRVENFKAEIKQNQLDDFTYFLPYIPHWLVPQFLRACTTVCFLENRFPILIHQPSVPREILAVGRCLVLSQEIRDKQRNKNEFIDKENYLLIPDPQDISYLASTLDWVISNPQAAEEIGKNGNSLYTGKSEASVYQALIDRITELTEYKDENTMSLAEFQQVILKTYTNLSFRSLLEENPEQILQSYELTQQERESLANLVKMKPQLEKFAESLYHKKFQFLWKQFNLVNKHFNLIESEFLRFFREQYDFQTRSVAEEVNYFANLLIFFGQTSPLTLPNCFNDIVRYEQKFRLASILPLADDIFENINQLNNSLTTNTRYLIKSPSVMVEQFNYNLLALYQGSNIDALKPETHIIAFLPSPKSITADVHDLSPTIYHLIETATEMCSIEDLVKAAALFNRVVNVTENFKRDCLQAIQDLCDKGILIYD